MAVLPDEHVVPATEPLAQYVNVVVPVLSTARETLDFMTEVQDVLEEMNITSPNAALASDELPEPAQGLLDCLGFDPVGLDALQARCGLAMADLQAELMALELEGKVARLPGGLFQRLMPDC